MTVSTTTTKNSYSANGTLHSFAYGFKIFADADLTVIVRSATGGETTKTLNTHYVVTNAGTDSGGNVLFKFNTGTSSDAHFSTTDHRPANGETVVILRTLTKSQGTDYVENDPFPSTSHEDALDRLTFITQELQEEVDRTIKLSKTNTMTSPEFTTSATDRASKILAFDSSGELSVTQELGTFKGDSATTTTAAFKQRDIIKATTTAQLNNIYICVADSVIGDALTDTDHFAVLVDAVAAAASATTATTKASEASTSATNASNSASTASGHKDTASTKATEAASSATAAASSATAAASSATSAATALDNFDDIFLGAKSSDPSTDNDSDALTAGDLYFNTTSSVLKVYTGSAWTTISSFTTGIANTNIPVFTSGVADDDFLRVAGTSIEGRSASEVLSDIGGQAALTFGIANTNIPKFTSGVADDDFLRVAGTTIEGRSASELLSDIGASAVAGSSSIVTTGALNAGSITSGFGAINNGASAITTTGVGTFGSLDISGAIDVAGTTNLDVVDIDGAVDMASTLQVDGAITSSAGMTITTADNTDQLILKSTDADANVGPVLRLNRDSGSPADSDLLGSIIFQADDDGGNTINFVEIITQMEDASADSRSADLFLMTRTNGSLISRIGMIDSTTVINDSGADIDFRVESNLQANMLLVDAGEDIVSIVGGGSHTVGSFKNTLQIEGTTGQTSSMSITRNTAGTSPPYLQFGKTRGTSVGSNTIVQNGDTLGIITFCGADGTNRDTNAAQIVVEVDGYTGENDMPGRLIFKTTKDGESSPTEWMRIKGYGALLIGSTNASPAEGTTAGTRIGGVGATQISVDGQTVLLVNRVQDGRVVAFHSAGTLEGEIGISGTTTTYGAFTGTHWSRLIDNSQPTILKGTIIETIDEMCDWYQAEFTKVAEVENGVEVLAEEKGRRTPIALPDGKSVGDTISITYEDVTYDDAVIVKEDDDKHTKCKISDTADSKSVYGVFCAWDADDDNVNDMKVASLGTHAVRIHKDVTVSKGDLLVSNGDGTAKVQDDDIIRSKTIGKVLTNIKQETYSDESYTVPCALYCG
jgi:hypothetical protein